jgi:hypothetical protein
VALFPGLFSDPAPQKTLKISSTTLFKNPIAIFGARQFLDTLNIKKYTINAGKACRLTLFSLRKAKAFQTTLLMLVGGQPVRSKDQPWRRLSD